jgi:hypothetical protein
MSTTLSFDQIAARVADFHAAEAARNAPKAAVIRCVFELSSLLADLSADDRAEILDLLKTELYALPLSA